ncbi:MAG: Importin subunit beta-1 [Marteilia pararefringens]
MLLSNTNIAATAAAASANNNNSDNTNDSNHAAGAETTAAATVKTNNSQLEVPNAASGSLLPNEALEAKILHIIEAVSHPKPGIKQKELFDELAFEQTNNYQNFLLTLSNITMNEEVQINIRMLCVIQLKNALHSKEKRKMIENQNKWMCIDQQIRNKIFANTFQLLNIKQFIKVAPLCLAHLCVMEHQSTIWKDLVTQLQRNVTSQTQESGAERNTSECLKCASLIALGFITKEMHEYFDGAISFEILNAVSFGLSDSSFDTKNAAANTLYNVLDVIQEPSRDKVFRDEVLRLIIGINNKDNYEKIRITSYACLVKVAEILFDYLSEYIQGLFKITLDGMTNANPFIVMYSIEFWRTICQKEYEILELTKLTENNNNSSNSNKKDASGISAQGEHSSDLGSVTAKNDERFYSYHVLPHIMMLLLQHLEGDGGKNLEGWTPCSSASHFLKSLSKCWGSTILDYVGSFFTTQIVKDEWYCKNAAVMALGAILDGLKPEQISNAMPQIWQYLLQLLYHPNEELRDTTCWLISELAKTIPEYVLQNCSQLIPQLTELLKDTIKISKTVSLTLTNILEAYKDLLTKNCHKGTVVELSQFAAYFSKPSDYIQLIQLFIANTTRNEDSLTIISFSSISYVIKVVGQIEEMQEVGLFAFETCLFNLEQAIANSQISIISAILLTMHSIIEDYGERNKMICHHIMNVLIKMDMHISIQKLEILPDVISLITLVISNLSDECKPYMSICVKIVIDGINDFQFDSETCRSSLSLLSILAGYCSTELFEMIGDQQLSKIMEDLKEIVLSNQEEAFSLKHLVLDCYGDLIMASSNSLFKFSQSILDTVMMALSSEFDVDSDVFQYKFAVQLYYSCMNSLCSLIQAFNNRTYPNNCQFIISALPDITKYILRIANCLNNDEDIQIALTGLIGDLSKFFPNEMVSCFKIIAQADFSNLYNDKSQNPTKGLNMILERAKFTDNEQLKNIYTYTAEQLKRAKIELVLV